MSSPSLTVEVCLPFRLVATRYRFQAPDPPGGPGRLPVNGLSANASTALNRTMAAEVERTGIEPVTSGLHPPARRRDGIAAP